MVAAYRVAAQKVADIRHHNRVLTTDLLLRAAGAQSSIVLDPYARAIIGRRKFGELGPVRSHDFV